MSEEPPHHDRYVLHDDFVNFQKQVHSEFTQSRQELQAAIRDIKSAVSELSQRISNKSQLNWGAVSVLLVMASMAGAIVTNAIKSEAQMRAEVDRKNKEMSAVRHAHQQDYFENRFTLHDNHQQTALRKISSEAYLQTERLDALIAKIDDRLTLVEGNRFDSKDGARLEQQILYRLRTGSDPAP